MDFTSFKLCSVQYLKLHPARKVEGKAGDPLITRAHDHEFRHHVTTISLQEAQFSCGENPLNDMSAVAGFHFAPETNVDFAKQMWERNL